jgi:16S rRNA (guanine527-N7)-methyltransferase
LVPRQLVPVALTSSVSVRLAELRDRYGLSSAAAEQLLRLVEILAEDPLAPTTVTDPGRIIDDHVADSLVALELTETRAAGAIADLGSGAGFPGLPLAIALPDAEVALVESSRRKCRFMDEVCAAVHAANARTFHTRAECWADGLSSFDVVTARAVAPLDVVAEYAAPLLRLGGTLVVWRGHRDPEAEAAGELAARQLGLEVHAPLPVVPYGGAHHRHLHVMSKVEKTPARFPRRPGAARKRPLGSEFPPSDRSRR